MIDLFNLRGRYEQRKRAVIDAFRAPTISADGQRRGQKHMPHVAIVILGLTITGTQLIFAGALLALGFVVRALSPKPRLPNFGDTARSLNLNITEPAAAVRVLYGARPIAGVRIYMDKRGTHGEYLDVVYALCGHPVHALGTVYFDGVALTLDGSGNETGTFAGLVHVEKKLGTAGEAAFPGLVADSAGKWTSAHKLDGQASLYVRFKWDQNKFANGLPNVTIDVQGREVYDPRDTTIKFTSNPALCIRDYLTAGFGLNLPTSKINDASVIAAANICDEAVNLRAGGTTPRYTLNGAFELGRGWDTDLMEMLSAMAGMLVPAGRIQLLAGAWRAPEGGFVLTDDDLRAPLQFDPLLSKRELTNTVKGLHVAPENKWEMADFPQFQDAAAVTEDGGEVLTADIRLPFTASAAIAQRLAKIECERSRHQGTLIYPAKLKAWRKVPGDVVPITHPRFGWSSKLFEVIEVKLAVEDNGTNDGPQAIGVDLQLRETADTIWNWDETTEETSLSGTAGTIVPPVAGVPAAPTGLHLVSGNTTALVQSDGARITRIRASWTAPADAFVTSGGQIYMQFKESASGTWVDLPPVAGDATAAYIGPLSDGVSYDVQIWAVNAAGAASSIVTESGHIASQGTGTAASGVLRPTTFVDTGSLAVVNPANVYDTDQQTAAFAVGGKISSVGKTANISFRGVPAAPGTLTAAKLVIKSALMNTAIAPPGAQLRYSLDNGSTWTDLYNQSTDRALASDQITLLTSQDMTQVRVDVIIGSSGTNNETSQVDLYDVRIEYSTP
jgi:hypothetical protein